MKTQHTPGPWEYEGAAWASVSYTLMHHRTISRNPL